MLLLLAPVPPASSTVSRWWWDLGVLSGAMETRFGVTAPDEVESVDFSTDVGHVSVIHYGGDDPLFVRVDGADPSVGGEAGTRVVLPGTRRTIDRGDLDGPTEVRVISAGIVSFEIEV